MNIEVLLTEAEIAKEFAESLEARDLPEKFFYWLPSSARAWQTLSAQSSYRELNGMWDLVNARCAELVEGFPSVVPVVSLGAGDGTRDRALVHGLERCGRKVKYFPVDASQTLLETACAAAEDEELDVLGIKADISSPMHIVLASDAAESPKVFLMSGNTIGGFDPLDQIRHIADTMKGGDKLILDAALSRETADEDELAELSRFTLSPLLNFGISEDDGVIRFETKQDRRRPGMQIRTKFFQAHRDVRFPVSGQEISIARGERVFMNFHYLFTPEAFRWLVKEHAGLRVAMEFISSENGFIAAVCSCS